MLQNIKGIYLPAHNGFRSFYHAIVYILHKKELKIELPFRRKILSLKF